jgi:hypothetical protein
MSLPNETSAATSTNPVLKMLIDDFINDLKDEISESSVDAADDSYARIQSKKAGIDVTLSADDCTAVFHSKSTVKHFYEVLGFPADAAIEVHNLSMCASAVEAVERCFSAVDET